ncbi:hypothetical protein PYW07_015506 [Mythimna separata]|uniref:Band 7 domain-containing protein n=1 Tax=Mythimna separata TaxID=271217 RepID=A0AAD7Z064_MYTSE|nr:hypothetical protein PYW07_015506 [Mythimna separata]
MRPSQTKEDLIKLEYTKYSTSESWLEKLFRRIAILIIILFPLVFVLCIRVVKQYKRAVVLRYGRLRPDSPAGPGIIWVIPCTDDVQMIDLRTQSFNLTPQEVLTKDSVTVTIDAVVYFHIERPLACILNIQNNYYATEIISIAAIRNILGGHSLYNLLTSRESISYKCRVEIEKTTIKWGVVIERVEIKDVFLPLELQKAMAAEAEGTRMAKAKIIEAEGEIQAAENLKEASLIMKENPNIMLVRYLQTLHHIAMDQATTVLFPIPLELPGPQLFEYNDQKGVPSDSKQKYTEKVGFQSDSKQKYN